MPFATIESAPLRGRSPLQMGPALLRLMRGLRQAREIVQSFRPDVTFVTGGYVTAPVAVASRIAGVPLLIYLPDVTPGWAVKWMSRLAQMVAITFQETATYFGDKAVVTGYPVRPELVRAAGNRQGARDRLGLRSDLPVVLVMGGSHGARSINRAITQGLDALLSVCQLIHVTGELDWPWVRELADQLPEAARARYLVRPYLHQELGDAMAAADLLVNRAGASNLGEIPAFGLPAILVPYPHAGRHQYHNAAYLAERGAARIIDDQRLEAELIPAILELLRDEEARQRMRERARTLASPDAAHRIAHLALSLAEGSR
ncbi:MAG: UDP-N-acetylglucosamine--N-acetylmuramyl-(pentapeptide) pyrophosphoryl-undecaprenol N-acetylglucosamine transferase [Anaerolineae bacterium]